MEIGFFDFGAPFCEVPKTWYDGNDAFFNAWPRPTLPSHHMASANEINEDMLRMLRDSGGLIQGASDPEVNPSIVLAGPVAVQQMDASTQEDHRYPFAGAANPKVKLGVVSAASTAAASEPPGEDGACGASFVLSGPCTHGIVTGALDHPRARGRVDGPGPGLRGRRHVPRKSALVPRRLSGG